MKKNSTLIAKVLILICLTGIGNVSKAQGILGVYDYVGSATCATGTSYSLITTNNIPTFATWGEFLRTSATLTCNTATAGNFSNSNWPTAAIDLTKYVSFQVTVTAGRRITLTSLDIRQAKSNNTAGTFYVRSSVDGYATNINGVAYTVPASNAYAVTNVPLPSGSFANLTTTVTFRLYAVIPTTSHVWNIDYVSVNGVATLNANAGTDITICQGLAATMAANDVSGSNSYPTTGGTGTWTLVSGSGTITSANSFNTTITGLSTGANTFRWTVTHSGSGAHTSFDDVVINVTPYVTPTISISSVPAASSGTVTICPGNNVTFTANVTNQGPTPSYQWYNNAGAIAGATSSTYSSTGLGAFPNDLIYCELICTTNGTTYCPNTTSVISSGLIVTYYPTPGISGIISGLSTVCAGQTGVVYTTSPGTPAPASYWWVVPAGASITAGQTTNSITVTWGSTSGNVSVYGVNTCTVQGPIRNRAVTVNPLVASPTLTIVDAAGGPTTLCQYASVNFSANITDPANLSKTAVWKVDGVPQYSYTGNSSANFVYPNPGSFGYGFPIAGAHSVTCEITFNGQPAPGQCYSPNVSISAPINYTIIQNEPPQVTIADVANGNHICRGTLDVFTATPFDAGTPTYTWYVDGIPDVSSTSATFNYIPATAGTHVVYCEVHSSQSCDNSPPSIYPDAISLNTVIVNVDPCTYYVPTSGNLGPYNACGGAFYDSQADPGSPYANNVNGTVTFCSALAGQYVSITFNSMVLADNTDILRLYSGIGTGGPLLQTYQGPLNTTSFCGAVVSQDVTGGCVTAQFQTGSSGVAAGWDGSIACSPTSSSTPAGANCASPTIISALPYTASNHTTQCFVNDYQAQSGICNSSYAGEDHVYVYTATGPECTSISMSGTSNSPALAVYQGCPGAGGICLTSPPMVGNNTMQFTFPSAGTYYIIVDETSGFSNYTMNIQSFGLAPANDLPCNAQYIDLAVNVNGNNSCTGSATEPGSSSCWTTGTLNTTWYSFISPSSPNPAAVKIRTTPGTIGSTQIALYSGTCSSLSEISCNQAGPNCATTPTPPSSEIIYSNLTPNTMYYIRVDGRNSSTGNYSIVVADVYGAQPYADGQDCVVPMTICNSVFTVGDPGFLWTGWVCDFGTTNTSCMFAGERSSAWYVFTTNGTGNIGWRLTPNGSTYVDYDWILMDITSFGGDQASRVASACPQINAGTIPWVRCNISDVILFAPCATSQYMTGMCPSSSYTTTTAFGPSFCSSLAVNAGQTFLLHLSNWTQNARGFTIDFNAFGTSPIAYSNPPSVLYWTGGANNTDWFNPVNWGNCGPPDCNTNAIITTGSTYMPLIANNLLANCKGLDIKAGASVTMVGNAQLDICGNFVNNGSLIAASTSTVNCIGSSAQYFDGNMIGSSSFGNLTMSKSAAGNSKMTLLDNALMTGTLTLANSAFGGKIVTGVKELYITNNSPSSCNPGSTTSYVEGNLRRNLDGTLSSSTYYFPLGHATPGFQFAKIDFTTTHTIPNILGYFSTWSSLPGPTGLTDGGACPVTYNTAPGFYNNGYWTLTASANASSANYDLHVRNGGVTNGPGLTYTVMKAATVAGPWSLNGTCNTTVTYPFAKRNGMNGFSVFATAQSANPVPITLLNFDAIAKGAEVQTTWATESEINNDYFIIERSKDGINFEQIGTRKGAGNSSNTLHYSFIDPNPYDGVSYYRLRQVDFDGASSKSEIVAVNFADIGVLNVFPNPAQTEIKYRFNSAAQGMVSVEIIDALGKVVYSEQVSVTKGLNTSESVNINQLPRGVYFVQVKPFNSEIIEPMQKRFVKQTRED